VVVEEAKENPHAHLSIPSGIPELAKILKDTIAIESVEGCRSFELTWIRYAAYLVTEELVGWGRNHSDEVFTGNLFRIYTKSHFLDHLARNAGGHIEPIQHYKLICENHIIDVASYSPPEILLIGSAPPPANRIQ